MQKRLWQTKVFSLCLLGVTAATVPQNCRTRVSPNVAMRQDIQDCLTRAPPTNELRVSIYNLSSTALTKVCSKVLRYRLPRSSRFVLLKRNMINSILLRVSCQTQTHQGQDQDTLSRLWVPRLLFRSHPQAVSSKIGPSSWSVFSSPLFCCSAFSSTRWLCI